MTHDSHCYFFLDVFPVNFEGAKIMVNKGLSNHFQISHTLNMSSVTPSGYRFGATYVGPQQYGPSEAYPILLGDIDPSGNLNANIIHQLNKNTRMKFVSQVNLINCKSDSFPPTIYFSFRSKTQNLLPHN